MARYDLSPSGFDVAGARIGIVAARFNDDVVSRLLEAALDTLARHGLDRESIPVARVPGAFELPLAARWLATCHGSLTDAGEGSGLREKPRTARNATADAVIALGAVIRGETPHFDYVCAEAARGIRAVSLELDVPVVFGVLTCDDHTQAHERAGGARPIGGYSDTFSGECLTYYEPGSNKGREAALAALEMVSLRRRFGA